MYDNIKDFKTKTREPKNIRLHREKMDQIEYSQIFGKNENLMLDFVVVITVQRISNEHYYGITRILISKDIPDELYLFLNQFAIDYFPRNKNL